MRSVSSSPGKAVLVAALLLWCAPAAHSSSIFDNLAKACSPYSQKQPSCGYFPVFGPKGDFAVPLSDYAAAQFTPSVSSLASDARFTVVQNAPGPGFGTSGSLTAAIYTDAGGFPGSRISQAVTGLEAPYCCNSATVTARFSNPVSLDAGIPYWLVLKPGATNTYVAWVVGGSAPVAVDQSLSGPSSQQCGWCSYGPSAVQFAIDSGTTPSPLTIVDPYLMTIPGTDQLSASAVVAAAAGGKDTAKGIVADGTTAAVVVFKANSSKGVTFSATNGAKLTKYTADFLTNLAGPGATSLTVTPAKIGAAFYALALVTDGTPPDADDGASVAITAQSAGNTSKAAASVLAIPTPVVLVHGLWGNLVSLASTAGYLQTTQGFTSHRKLVTPICYSIYLGFDAAADTLPHNGTACEVTSAESLHKYLSQTLYPQLDANHYVGARVDVVAHSMGGLAVRHFADTAGYKSARNRFLGAFRKVITLDTPETGSALAAYLDETGFNRTRQVSNPFSPAYLLWTTVCGASATVTVEQCFDASGLPLSYPGTALETGAVYSLIPAGHSIASAPPAGIFNTAHGRWYAIASDYRNDVQPHALLRDVLNTVIAATYSSSPPNVDSILGSQENDVVVTVSSQTSTAPAAQTKQFKDLQHTPAPGEAKLLFSGDSNASVTGSSAVNGQVAFWLGLQSAPAPAAGKDESEPEQNWIEPEPGRSRVKAIFLTPGRLSASLPGEPVGLGQPVRIPLKFAGPNVVDIAVDQTVPETGETLRNQTSGAEVGSGRAKVVSREPGGATIEVSPLALGTVNLRVSVLYADGGLDEQKYQLRVVPSAEGLTRFDLNKGFKVLALVMEDREEDRQAYLFPEVQYQGLDFPVYLSNSEMLNLTVDQPVDDPIVRVDPDGLVHALRAGTATVTGDFDGAKDSVKVTVYEPGDAPAGYRRAED